ncbi:MAG: hypothetical protein ACOX6U_08680 [Oscillospiraceae bacterium]|jgi:hypothetical protein
MSDDRTEKKVVKDDESNSSKASKEQIILDTPEINVGKIRNYYINADGHLSDD